MNYLLYVEHAAENLQFFLWYRDYVERFNDANTLDTGLSPEWTQAMEDETAVKIQKDAVEMRKESKTAIAIFRGTDFEKGVTDIIVENRNPFSTPPSTPSVKDAPSILLGSQVSSYRTHVQDAFSAAGITQPCTFTPTPTPDTITSQTSLSSSRLTAAPPVTIQPFRAEVNRVVATYIAPSAPRQLNLSSREQKAAVAALAYTTHPSALRAVARLAEDTLRRQAHPNFVRWSVRNGNPARVRFALGLGVSIVGLATVGAVALTLGSAGRGWRALFAVGWAVGVATLWAAGKGMCVVLHGLHHRHVRPWELFDSSFSSNTPTPTHSPNPSSSSSSSSSSSPSEEGGSELEEGRGRRKGADASLDSFGSGNSSYEDEPWVRRYERRNIVRKVFDREVWIREPALRRIQDAIFAQSVLVGLLAAGVLTAVFVAVPAGGFF